MTYWYKAPNGSVEMIPDGRVTAEKDAQGNLIYVVRGWAPSPQPKPGYHDGHHKGCLVCDAMP